MRIFCINCPKGCELEVLRGAEPANQDGGGDIAVKGAGCPRGEAYGKAELVNPTRMVTGLVRVAGVRKPLPVKSKTAIPKSKIDEVLFAMHQATVQLPIAIGDVIITNVADTKVDLVATANYC